LADLPWQVAMLVAAETTGPAEYLNVGADSGCGGRISCGLLLEAARPWPHCKKLA